jgi:hypothetical protein
MIGINDQIKEIVKNYADEIKDTGEIYGPVKYWITPGNNEGYYLDIMGMDRTTGLCIRYHCNASIIADHIKEIELLKNRM